MSDRVPVSAPTTTYEQSKSFQLSTPTLVHPSCRAKKQKWRQAWHTIVTNDYSMKCLLSSNFVRQFPIAFKSLKSDIQTHYIKNDKIRINLFLISYYTTVDAESLAHFIPANEA